MEYKTVTATFNEERAVIDAAIETYASSLGTDYDRAMQPGKCRLTVWTQRGKQIDLPCEVRV